MELTANFLNGTLGANLTTSGTTITFGVAPPFPTLVSPQFIKLVLDFTEVVYLTAYTSGATTGTILRGQEGTTGKAHSSGSGTWWNNPTTQNFPADELHLTQYGIFGNTGNDLGAIINNQLADFSANVGACTAVIPPGGILGSIPFVFPPLVSLRGPGWNSSFLRVTTDNDVLQAFQGNGTTSNAFFSTIENLLLHGVGQLALTAGNWNNGLTIVTNPLNTAAAGDPDFDPQHVIQRLWIKLCSGEGFYQSGRSETTLIDVWVAYCNGAGFWGSYDTEYIGCKAEGVGTGGWYISHSDVKLAACNSYNNGTINPFASGTAYTLSTVVISAGLLYACKLAYTSTATVPASDTTHWVKITPTQRPTGAAPEYGYGFYLDAVSRVEMAACGADENATGGIYLHNSNANTIQVRISNVNFNQNTDTTNATNPNNYSCLVLDGSSNNNITITCASNPTGYAIKLINGSTRNNIFITTDGTEVAILSPDTTSLVGNAIFVNGHAWHVPDNVYTPTLTTTSNTIPDGYPQVQYNLNHLHTTLAVTLPPAEAGKSLFIGFTQDTNGGVTWSLPGTVLWVGGIVPTPTTAASSIDAVALDCVDGTHWIATPLLANAT